MSDHGSPPGAPRRSRIGRNIMSGQGSPPISPTRPGAGIRRRNAVSGRGSPRASTGRPRSNANSGILGGIYAGLDRVLGSRIERLRHAPPAPVIEEQMRQGSLDEIPNPPGEMRRDSLNGIPNPPPAYQPPPTYLSRDDYARFGRLDAEMATVFQDINRRGTEINQAINNHAEQYPPNPSREVSPFQWNTPGSIDGPDEYDPETGRTLPRRLPGELDLSAEMRPDLFKADELLRTHLLELETIRGWWANNRNEWGLRRQDLQFLDTSIAGLLIQLGGEANVEGSGDAPARQHLELQRELANSKLRWFAENERHMEAVEKKFKNLANQIDQMVDKFKKIPVNVNQSFVWREGFSCNLPYTSAEFTDGRTVKWFSSSTMTGRVVEDMAKQLLASNVVTRKMHDDRVQQHHYLKVDLEGLRNLKAVRMRDSLGLQAQIERQRGLLRDATSKDPDLDHPMYDDSADEIRAGLVNFEEDGRNAERLENECTEQVRNVETKLLFLQREIALLKREQIRGKAVAVLMLKFEALWKDYTIDFIYQEHVDFFHDVYNICRIYYLHTINMRKIFADLDHDDFLNTDRAGIYDDLENIHARYQQEFQPSINFLTLPQRPPGTYVDTVLEPFKQEAIEVGRVHRDAKSKLETRKAILAPTAPSKRPNEFEGRLREVTLGDGQILNRRAPAWQSALGRVNNVEEAEALLQTGIDVVGHNNKPAYEALREFFVSPDIADNFRFLYQTKRPVLLELINSFIRTPIHEYVLDAFLLICHDKQDLFQLAWGGSVSSLDQGWELVEENPIAGPTRRITPVRPFMQASNIEQWLLARKTQFVLPIRDIDRARLGGLIAVGFPDMKPKEIMEAVHFFSSAGRLYRVARTQPGGVANNIRRIDNGWGIDAIDFPNYDSPITFSPKTEAFCKTYLKAFQSLKKRENYVASKLRVPDQSTETELLNICGQRLADTFILWYGKIVPTPHKFHLFLRWCTQNHPGHLKLTRNGVVTGDLL